MHISALIPAALLAANLVEHEYNMTYLVEGDVVYFTVISKTSKKRIVLDMVVDNYDRPCEVRVLHNDLLTGDQYTSFVNVFTTCVKATGLSQ